MSFLNKGWMKPVWMMLGFVLIGLGIALFFISDIGSNPLSTLVEGIMKQTGMLFGTVNLIASFILLIIAYPSTKKFFGIGTILNMVLIGYLVDFWSYLLNYQVIQNNLLLSLIISCLGTLVLALGVALYMYVDLGYGPYEMFMEMIVIKTKWPIATARTIQEILILVIGIVLGGRYGLGTIINALATGYLITFFLKWIKRGLGEIN